jgi:cob(I)alamin adenosyltransferase
MFVVGAQLATAEKNQTKLEEGVSKVTPDMTGRAEADIDALIEEHPLPQEFVLPGETPGSAGLDLARSTVRRAERQAVAMNRAGLIPDDEILRYLNRVSDLLFTLARYEEAERGRRAAPSRER